MRGSLKRIAYAVLLLSLCCICALPAAYAADASDYLQGRGSFTIVMEYGGSGGVPIPGAGITLYHVANTRIKDGRLVPTDAFAAAGAEFGDLGDLRSEKNLAAVPILRSFAAQNGGTVAGMTRTTGTDGTAVFEDLSAGLYLVTQTGSVGAYYDMNPFLLSVPMAGASGTEPLYDIKSNPKTEIVKRPTDPGPGPGPGSDPDPNPGPGPGPGPGPNPNPDRDPDPNPDPDPEPKPNPDPNPDPEPGPAPPIADGHSLVPGTDGNYIEMDENGVSLGEWRWDEATQQWIFDEFPPLAILPQTGQLRWPVPVLALAGMLLFVFGWMINRAQRRPAALRVKAGGEGVRE